MAGTERERKSSDKGRTKGKDGVLNSIIDDLNKTTNESCIHGLNYGVSRIIRLNMKY